MKKFFYNKIYRNFDDFRQKSIDFLANKNWRNYLFKNILTDNYQIINQNFSRSYL